MRHREMKKKETKKGRRIGSIQKMEEGEREKRKEFCFVPFFGYEITGVIIS